MRVEVENPMIKEPPAQMTIGYLDILSKREKIPGLDKYRAMWKEMERRERANERGNRSNGTGIEQLEDLVGSAGKGERMLQESHSSDKECNPDI